MTERQIEMHWYCATCNHDNRGRDLGCANCGKPREAEEDLMPSDTRTAPTITDPELLRKATAGANWSCHYCQSSQRRLDGACARCGAPADEGTTEGELPRQQQTAPPISADVADDDPPPSFRPAWARHAAIIAGALAVLGALIWVLFVPHPRDVRVAAVSWRHSIEIERFKLVREDGWSPPSDAIGPTVEGMRVHHYDHRLVGSHSERYTVQVACGQTCTPIPRSCSESCTSNRNGFATCRTSCTGGGQSCSTKYCSEGRTRSVD